MHNYRLTVHSVQRGAKVRCELRAKTEINAIFTKYFCGDIYSNHLKVKPRVVSKRFEEYHSSHAKGLLVISRLSTCPTVHWEEVCSLWTQSVACSKSYDMPRTVSSMLSSLSVAAYERFINIPYGFGINLTTLHPRYNDRNGLCDGKSLDMQ